LGWGRASASRLGTSILSKDDNVLKINHVS
jgi:hypothetical protein